MDFLQVDQHVLCVKARIHLSAQDIPAHSSKAGSFLSSRLLQSMAWLSATDVHTSMGKTKQSAVEPTGKIMVLETQTINMTGITKRFNFMPIWGVSKIWIEKEGPKFP